MLALQAESDSRSELLAVASARVIPMLPNSSIAIVMGRSGGPVFSQPAIQSAGHDCEGYLK